MLPQGSRSAAIPRVTSTPASATAIENRVSDRSASDGSTVTRGDLRFRCGPAGRRGGGGRGALVERGLQPPGQLGEGRGALAAAARQRRDGEHGTAAFGGR